MPEVNTLAVIGAGDMGHGVAELAAMRGFEVRLRDIEQEILDRAMAQVRWSLDKLAEKQAITADEADAAFDRITATTDLAEAVDGVQLVIEAVPENLELKQKVFAEIEQAAPADAVLASNTSTMMISEIGAKLEDPSRLVGMHFFNPVLLMDLIEIIPSDRSSDEAVATVEAVSDALGKTHVTLSADTPGFVTSRLIGIWVGASALAAEHGVAEPDVIDSAMKFKAGFPMGPFELADYTGLDIGVHASEYIASHLGGDYAPLGSLKDLVDAGKLGKKTGEGVYEWDGHKMTTTLSPDKAGQFDPSFVLSIVANEAARLLDEGVASARDIDLCMRNGCAFPKGPLEWADQVGLDTVVENLGTMSNVESVLVQPSPALQQRVDDGRLGRAAGEGFYEYEAAGADEGHEYGTILVDVDAEARVATVTLNRPHRLHALNDELIADLSNAFNLLEADDDVRVILLTATGEKAFCVGADLQDAEGFTPALGAEVAHQGHQLCVQMEKLGKPIVCAVNGYAFGGGLELTLPCDFRVAARRAQFALPEVTIGLLPAMGGTQRLPKLIGLSAAKEFAMLGERVSADDAHRLGLVHRVYDNESFMDEAREFAATLATRAPIAMRITKRLLNAAPETPMSAGMEAEALAFGLLSSTEDVVEGVSSMFMKKTPEFEGK